MMCEVKLTREDGSRSEYVLPYEMLWISHGNFTGLGKFSEIIIKIKE
tara:strand:+ start:2278 stop:2418 length:141 start_codon:yes stop_codon:yes gene_type:complete